VADDLIAQGLEEPTELRDGGAVVGVVHPGELNGSHHRRRSTV
jgi:hypothetical protein